MKKFTSLGIASCISISVLASNPDTLIAQGGTWKYLDDGSDQGTAWILPGFADTGWASGPAEFGYGDGDEATVVSYGPSSTDKYITTYFRKSFNITDVAPYKSLRLYLKRDDGAVVYLNGSEIYRSNMPEGTITDTTLASAAISGGAEMSFIRVFLSDSLLVNGNNVVAVEVHQADVGSSDLSFDMSLFADTTARISRGPYLQRSAPSSLVVRWNTSIPEISKVLFGTSMAYSDSVLDTAMVYRHEIAISGLQPNTWYYYAVCSASEIMSGDSGNHFRTAPLPGTVQPVRLWAMGDFGTGNVQQNQVRDAYNNFRGSDYTDLILWLGDNAYPEGSDEEYSENVFTDHYEYNLTRSVVYSAFGNHELFYSSAANQTGPYFDMFTFPTNGEGGGIASGTEAYYSFDYANIHFVCLESNIDSFGTANTNVMISWLNTDLAATQLHWTIVFFHCPPYSRGYHDSDIYPDMIYMRQNIVPILESYHVDLVLSGHDHDYERSYMMNGHYGMSSTFSSSMLVDSGSGVLPDYYEKLPPDYKGTVYAISGCGGDFEEVQSTWPHPAMVAAYDSVYGSLAIDVSGDTLTGTFIRSDDVIADRFSIRKHGNIGIDEQDKLNSWIVYPNPAHEAANLLFTGLLKGKMFATIYDAVGRKIQSFDVSSNVTAIDMIDFHEGFYFIQIAGENFVKTLQVLKMKY